jgi:hypothetical protein
MQLLSSVLSLLLLLPALASAAKASASASSSRDLYTSDIPLSPTGYTFSRGNLASSLKVDLFIDLACSDCMNEWPLLTEVYETYGSDFKFSYHLFPLPYHQFAFLLSKSATIIDTYGTDPSAVFRFFDTVYVPSNQALIYNSATSSLSYNDVQSIVGSWVANCSDVSLDVYNTAMLSDEDSEMNTRYMWKSIADRGGVFGTPTFAVNDVYVNDVETFVQWDEMLGGLLALAAKKKGRRDL